MVARPVELRVAGTMAQIFFASKHFSQAARGKSCKGVSSFVTDDNATRDEGH